jgi:hypothetical protein
MVSDRVGSYPAFGRERSIAMLGFRRRLQEYVSALIFRQSTKERILQLVAIIPLAGLQGEWFPTSGGTFGHLFQNLFVHTLHLKKMLPPLLEFLLLVGLKFLQSKFFRGRCWILQGLEFHTQGPTTIGWNAHVTKGAGIESRGDGGKGYPPTGWLAGLGLFLVPPTSAFLLLILG